MAHIVSHLFETNQALTSLLGFLDKQIICLKFKINFWPLFHREDKLWTVLFFKKDQWAKKRKKELTISLRFSGQISDEFWSIQKKISR